MSRRETAHHDHSLGVLLERKRYTLNDWSQDLRQLPEMTYAVCAEAVSGLAGLPSPSSRVDGKQMIVRLRG